MRSAISAGSIGTPLWVPRIEPSVRSISTTTSVFFAVVLLGGGNQRRFDALEDDFLVDILIAVDRIDDPKQFVGVHSISLSSAYGQYSPRPARPTKMAETLQNLTRPQLSGFDNLVSISAEPWGVKAVGKGEEWRDRQKGREGGDDGDDPPSQ